MKLALKLILIPAGCLVLVVSDKEWSKLGKRDERLAEHNFFHQTIFVVTSIQSKSSRQKHVITTIESCRIKGIVDALKITLDLVRYGK